MKSSSDDKLGCGLNDRDFTRGQGGWAALAMNDKF
jgi:hypothetical protein